MLVVSSGLLLISVKAVSFGLDADGKWGEPRVGLFLIGITGILVSVFLILADKLDQRHAPRNYSVESRSVPSPEFLAAQRFENSDLLETANPQTES